MSLSPNGSTVDGIVRRSAHTFRDRVALRFAEREWTYAGLDDAVSRAAAHLLGLGLTKGDRVAAYGKNSMPISSASSPVPVRVWSTCRSTTT